MGTTGRIHYLSLILMKGLCQQKRFRDDETFSTSATVLEGMVTQCAKKNGAVPSYRTFVGPDGIRSYQR